MNILLVDDEVLVTKGLSLQLKKYKPNWQVVSQAIDGIQAMEILETHHVDVMVTDIRMPDKNGLELSKEAKRIHSNLSIIMLTGYAEFEYAQEAIRCGANDYFLKPVDYLELIEKIEQIETERSVRPHKLSTLEKAIRYIDKNFHSPTLSLTEVADEIKVSTHHLSRLFKQEHNELFINYLTNIRIEHAKRLLVEEMHMKVYEVGEAVGYMDRHYFSQIFKKMVGMTPNQFRESHQKIVINWYSYQNNPTKYQYLKIYDVNNPLYTRYVSMFMMIFYEEGERL